MRTDTSAPKGGAEPPIMDSGVVADQVASGGALAFYLQTLRTDPRKIIVGAFESLVEVLLFILWPRFPTKLGLLQRIRFVRKAAVAELKVPGGTTLLETIWLVYGTVRASSAAKYWVEVGCFKGLSTVRLSLLCQLWDRHLYVCDTFTGLPGSDAVYTAVDNGVSYHFKAGSYAGTEQEVHDNVAAYGDPTRITLIKGNVDHSLRENSIGKISFAFLDVDLVESYKACFFGLSHNIDRGTVIAIHEACYRPIRDLIENAAYWKEIGLPAPYIEYVAERYGIASCRNIAFLSW